MSDEVKYLNSKEKRFLAGSIKKMVLANSIISEQETNDLNGHDPNIPFPYYEKYLIEFEEKIQTDEDFWNYAQKITNPLAQEIILKFLYQLSLEDGYMSSSESHFYQLLENSWHNKRKITER